MRRSLCTWRDKIFTATLPLRRMMINPQILMDSWRFSRLHRFWYLRKSHQREKWKTLWIQHPLHWKISNAIGALHSNLMKIRCQLARTCEAVEHAQLKAFGVWQNVCSSSLGTSTIEVWFLVGAQPPTPPTPPWNGEMRQAKTLAQDPHLRYSAVGAGAGAAVMGAGGFCTATSVGFRSKASGKSSNRHH